MMSSIFRRLLYLLRRSRHDADLREEIETHRALRQAALERDGVPPGEAVWMSRRAMGNVTLAVEDVREVWVVRAVDQVWQDVRFALRGLRRSPGFAFAAVGTFALALGANTAIFSVVNATLLKPLPYARPGELVTVWTRVPQLEARFPRLAIRAIDFQEYRQSNRVFTELAAVRERDFNLIGSGEPERVFGARVSANLFPLLGVEPALGRTFVPEEDAPGRDAVVVISHALWHRRFGGDAQVINRTLSLDGRPHVVIGVMPAGFLFPTGKQLHSQIELGPHIDVWKPAAFSPDELEDALIGFSWGMIGRLAPGTTHQAAEANLDVIARGIAQRLRAKARLANLELYTQVRPLRDVYVGDAQQWLLMVMAAVGLLLVIACVNIVNLLLARLSGRSRELAARAALGASRSRLIRQSLVESAVVAALGGAVGLPIASWATQLLVSIAPFDLDGIHAISVDASVLLFALTVMLVAGLVVGLLPAIEACRGQLHDVANDRSRGATTGKRSSRVRRALVMSEVALCTALLVIASVLLRSFVNLMSVERGFEVDRVLSLDLSLSPDKYQGMRRVTFFRDLLDDLRALPAVASAGAVSVLPLTSQAEGNTFLIYREADTQESLDQPIAQSRAVTEGYFAAIGIPLTAGRLLSSEEPASHVVVSEGLAARLWPGAAPSSVVGRRIKIQELTDDPATIVGVVGDVRAAALDRDPSPVVYVPHVRNRARAMTIVIRTLQDPETLAPAVRARIWNRDNTIPIERMRTMDEVVSESVALRRFQTALVLLFAVAALGLALVGVYGVTSYAVARQTKEFGVRFALGAQRSDLLKSVLVQGMRPVAAGLLLGAALAWAATAAMRSLLFGVAPLDPASLGTVAIVLMATAAIACYVPARRAARMDALVALRHD